MRNKNWPVWCAKTQVVMGLVSQNLIGRCVNGLRIVHQLVSALVVFWRRKWHPTPVFLPGEFVDRGAWQATVYGVQESDTAKWLSTHTLFSGLLSGAKVGVFQWVKYIVSGYKLLFEKHFGAALSSFAGKERWRAWVWPDTDKLHSQCSSVLSYLLFEFALCKNLNWILQCF